MGDPPRLRPPDDVLADIIVSRRPLPAAFRSPPHHGGRHLHRIARDDTSDFFARPSVARRVTGRLESFVPTDQPGDEDLDIVDCCNELLLLEEHVVNPATRRWVRLPRCDGLPEGHEGVSLHWSYLAFDPTVSPHYKVVSMRHPFSFSGDEGKKRLEGLRWSSPVSVYAMRVYSSRTGSWEERRFALDDDDERLQRRIIDGVSVRVYGMFLVDRGSKNFYFNLACFLSKLFRHDFQQQEQRVNVMMRFSVLMHSTLSAGSIY